MLGLFGVNVADNFLTKPDRPDANGARTTIQNGFIYSCDIPRIFPPTFFLKRDFRSNPRESLMNHRSSAQIPEKT